MGERIELARRTAELPLLGKDQTVVILTVTQPVTPLFKVHEAVEIARADERVAEANLLRASAQLTTKVEQTYFALLIAQRRFAVINGKPHAGIELITAKSEARELTSLLNGLIGSSGDTELDLALPPSLVVEPITLVEATRQAVTNSPEVVAAELTVVKARSAATLSKLDYVPDIAIIGGYSFQNAIPPLPEDFSFIGFEAAFNIFDFGKREKIVQERRSQVALAEANMNLVKANAAASAKTAFLEMNRARELRDLKRERAALFSSRSLETITVDYQEGAGADIEMLQAEMEYRIAYTRLKQIMEGR